MTILKLFFFLFKCLQPFFVFLCLLFKLALELLIAMIELLQYLYVVLCHLTLRFMQLGLRMPNLLFQLGLLHLHHIEPLNHLLFFLQDLLQTILFVFGWFIDRLTLFDMFLH